MARKSLVAAVLASLMVAACGGARQGAPAAPGMAPESSGDAPAQMNQGVDSEAAYGQPGAPPSASPKASAGASADGAFEERSAEPAPETRPGLGTRWGENRESHVSTAPFFREDPDSPVAMTKLFYNDSTGVRAMARRAGVSDFSDGSSRAGSGAFTVRLLDAGGRPLEGFSTGSNTYVIGEHGQRYIIQIRNNTGNRFEAVATVDGLDVINGRAGSFANRGYILNPFATVEIDGFRRSTDTVAAFRFGTVSSSYAAKKGNDRNVGVIGVAFFQERGSSWPWTPAEVDRRHNADPFPGRFSTPPPNDF